MQVSMKFLLVTRFITGCSEAFGTPPRVCSFLSIFAKTVQPPHTANANNWTEKQLLGKQGFGMLFLHFFQRKYLEVQESRIYIIAEVLRWSGALPPVFSLFFKKCPGSSPVRQALLQLSRKLRKALCMQPRDSIDLWASRTTSGTYPQLA